MNWFDGFPGGLRSAGAVDLFVRTGGKSDGPPLLLLHGYPETHAMWRRVAVGLAADFSLVIPDLRGYGDSTKPAPAATPELDRASRTAGARIACDLLVLWGTRGVVGRLYDPLALWRAQCDATVEGEAMEAGHFIPEELPEDTVTRLRAFLAR